MTDRTPWNAGNGCLPQLFRIGDIVRMRQDGSAPRWSADWADVRLLVIGAMKDELHPGRVCYLVFDARHKDRSHAPFEEDLLELYP